MATTDILHVSIPVYHPQRVFWNRRIQAQDAFVAWCIDKNMHGMKIIKFQISQNLILITDRITMTEHLPQILGRGKDEKPTKKGFWKPVNNNNNNNNSNSNSNNNNNLVTKTWKILYRAQGYSWLIYCCDLTTSRTAVSTISVVFLNVYNIYFLYHYVNFQSYRTYVSTGHLHMNQV